MKFEALLHQLYQTTRVISKGLNRRLEPLGIYTSEWSVIIILKENGFMTQAGLANYLNIEAPAITKTLTKLEKKGLIERKPGSDKREKNVYLTERALAEYPKWAEVVKSHRNTVLANLPEPRQEELFTLLKTIFLSAQQSDEV